MRQSCMLPVVPWHRRCAQAHITCALPHTFSCGSASQRDAYGIGLCNTMSWKLQLLGTRFQGVQRLSRLADACAKVSREQASALHLQCSWVIFV